MPNLLETRILSWGDKVLDLIFDLQNYGVSDDEIHNILGQVQRWMAKGVLAPDIKESPDGWYKELLGFVALGNGGSTYVNKIVRKHSGMRLKGQNLDQYRPVRKTSYISQPAGLLDVTIIRDNDPRVVITLDLGIPNFTVFSLKMPVLEQPGSMTELLAEALSALLDEMSCFMLSLSFDEKIIVAIYAMVLATFKEMAPDSKTDASQSQVGRDDTVVTYEGSFQLPQQFVDETHKKVVVGAVQHYCHCGKKATHKTKDNSYLCTKHATDSYENCEKISSRVLKRVPKVRRVELSVEKPQKVEKEDLGRVIRQYRYRSLKTQPRNLFMVVYDQQGRPAGVLDVKSPLLKKRLR